MHEAAGSSASLSGTPTLDRATLVLQQRPPMIQVRSRDPDSFRPASCLGPHGTLAAALIRGVVTDEAIPGMRRTTLDVMTAAEVIQRQGRGQVANLQSASSLNYEARTVAGGALEVQPQSLECLKVLLPQ
ncbi:hypothetical protein LTS10_012124 [Elasticomyces elasticus]|nr:hypothetical protein LTS10_012124 [Elasticomyces elasticus]